MTAKFGVAIIGCGFIGQKRAGTLGSRGRLLACADPEKERADSVARRYGGAGFADWAEALATPGVQVVIVATRHDALAEITAAAIRAGKHVLVEKPAGRNPDEVFPLLELAAAHGVKVHVGFNHRYHRAFRKAREIVDGGAIGELMFLRARYGHGGRPGYDREWRADPVLSGGGELIDQGPHLIDLAGWFLGHFAEVQGFAHTYYWDMPVDDNGFMILRTAAKQVAFLHASCTEWKNLFSFELYGRQGKLEVTGLGGSYGTERLTHYHMLPEMGPPETTSWEYPMADDSWVAELQEFLDDIELDRAPAAGLDAAIAALVIVQQIYKASGYDHHA
ncbi:Gfo/Idh/MocA family protein [Bosea sp. NBC_00550]|uniref:Gfo/Idh/MocA family protein n=1 Tax=Bosea sp. NBC_00550 TaxID=2969621 RepID=UPI00222F51F7|nr:Gfo/Idh/MocA family oxidoreductase [Bosea sp. NBC_00550]UZF91291.1 Gfo/Idh/MocA family oxidoreductase [Bosea sp. NBC_00550]